MGIDLRALLIFLFACGPDPVADTVVDDTDEPTSETSELPTYATPIQICINEVMSDNSGSLEVDGEYPDWIELHNPTTEWVALENWLIHDADGGAFRMDGSYAIEAGGFLLLYASDLDLPGHLPFKLDDDGDSVVLIRPDETFIELNFPDAATDWAYARETDCCSGDCWVTELWGTPGETNVIAD